MRDRAIEEHTYALRARQFDGIVAKAVSAQSAA
jgi:hypothetical protein